TRIYLLHELREPQGLRARRKPTRGARVLLDRTGTSSQSRWQRGPDFTGRVREVFHEPSARAPTRRVGVHSKRGHRRPRGTRETTRGVRAKISRRSAAAAVLGRFRPVPDANRILAGTAQPPSRSLSLHQTSEWNLDDRPAGAVTDSSSGGHSQCISTSH